MHFDYMINDSRVVRLSMSNIYREFKVSMTQQVAKRAFTVEHERHQYSSPAEPGARTEQVDGPGRGRPRPLGAEQGLRSRLATQVLPEVLPDLRERAGAGNLHLGSALHGHDPAEGDEVQGPEGQRLVRGVCLDSNPTPGGRPDGRQQRVERGPGRGQREQREQRPGRQVELEAHGKRRQEGLIHARSQRRRRGEEGGGRAAVERHSQRQGHGERGQAKGRQGRREDGPAGGSGTRREERGAIAGGDLLGGVPPAAGGGAGTLRPEAGRAARGEEERPGADDGGD